MNWCGRSPGWKRFAGRNASGLGIIRDAKRDGVLVGRSLEITMPGRAEHAVPGAVGIERVDEIAFVGDQLGEALRAVSRRCRCRCASSAAGEGFEFDQPVQAAM
jgi:hypothetical protein